jgi:regulator of replication initiation timing
MTKLWKIAAIAILVVAVGVGLYKANQARDARAELQKLKAARESLTKEISDLQASLAAMKNQLANLQEENSRLKTSTNETELLSLRDEVARLRSLPDDFADLQKQLQHSSPILASWKTNDLADVGRATPVDALRSFAYASQFAPGKMQNSFVGDDVDPPSEEALQKYIKNKIEHQSLIVDMPIAGYKILSQSWLATDKVRVDLGVMAGEDYGISFPFTLRNVNGEWKLVLFNIRDKHGAVTEIEPIKDSPYQ